MRPPQLWCRAILATSGDSGLWKVNWMHLQAHIFRRFGTASRRRPRTRRGTAKRSRGSGDPDPRLGLSLSLLTLSREALRLCTLCKED